MYEVFLFTVGKRVWDSLLRWKRGSETPSFPRSEHEERGSLRPLFPPQEGVSDPFSHRKRENLVHPRNPLAQIPLAQRMILGVSGFVPYFTSENLMLALSDPLNRDLRQYSCCPQDPPPYPPYLRCVIAQAFCSPKSFREMTLNSTAARGAERKGRNPAQGSRGFGGCLEASEFDPSFQQFGVSETPSQGPLRAPERLPEGQRPWRGSSGGLGEVCSFSTERENKVGRSEAPKRSHFPGWPLRGFQPSGSYPWATDNKLHYVARSYATPKKGGLFNYCDTLRYLENVDAIGTAVPYSRKLPGLRDWPGMGNPQNSSRECLREILAKKVLRLLARTML